MDQSINPEPDVEATKRRSPVLLPTHHLLELVDENSSAGPRRSGRQRIAPIVAYAVLWILSEQAGAGQGTKNGRLPGRTMDNSLPLLQRVRGIERCPSPTKGKLSFWTGFYDARPLSQWLQLVACSLTGSGRHNKSYTYRHLRLRCFSPRQRPPRRPPKMSRPTFLVFSVCDELACSLPAAATLPTTTTFAGQLRAGGETKSSHTRSHKRAGAASAKRARAEPSSLHSSFEGRRRTSQNFAVVA